MRQRARSSGLLAACDDPNLIAFPLWPRQRELLAAVAAGPRLHVLALGRRSGKTTLAALLAVHDCLFRPHLATYLRPGEKRYSVAVATSRKQAGIFLDAARVIVEGSPVLARLVAEIREDEIEFANRTVIRALPATARGVRGLPCSSILFDEAAHMLDLDGNASAEPMWRSLAPSLSQFGEHGRAIVASTPFGSSGWFAELFERVAAGEVEGAAAHHATSAQMNPTLDPSLLRVEHERDPDGFRCEYLAEFVAGGGAFFDPAALAEAATLPGPLEPQHGTAWIAGFDAGFLRDPSALVIVGRETIDGRYVGIQHPRLVVAQARTWTPPKHQPVSFDAQADVRDAVLEAVAAVCLEYRAKVAIDQHQPAAIRDFFSRRGLTVTISPLTPQTKTAAFSEVRARLYSGSLVLPDHPELLRELRNIRTQYRAGSAGVTTPRTAGAHSDLAVAMSMAVAQHARPAVTWQEGDNYVGGTRLPDLEPWDISGKVDPTLAWDMRL